MDTKFDKMNEYLTGQYLRDYQDDIFEKSETENIYFIGLSDLFMQRVYNGGVWSFFPADVAGDLVEKWGATFNSHYLQLEEKKLYTKQMKASDLLDFINKNGRDKGNIIPLFCDKFIREHKESYKISDPSPFLYDKFIQDRKF